MHLFTSLAVQSVAKSEDDLYVVNAYVCDEHIPLYLITFDLSAKQYADFVEVVEPPTVRDTIRSALTRQPFKLHLTTPDTPLASLIEKLPTFWVAAAISDQIITNENESFCPFVAVTFF
jgi:hypothetical protein